MEISDCVFEGRDQEDIGAGDQVQCFTYKSSTVLFLIIPGFIIVICREDGCKKSLWERMGLQIVKSVKYKFKKR